VYLKLSSDCYYTIDADEYLNLDVNRYIHTSATIPALSLKTDMYLSEWEDES